MDVKEIPGFSGYFCDREGGIWSTKTGGLRPMKLKANRGGYQTVALSLGTRGKYKHALVHRLVLSTWVGAPEGLHGNHKNGIRTDNRLDNLEWVTRSENERHARGELGKLLHGTHHPLSKLDDDKVVEIRRLRAEGRTYQSLADQFGICLSQAARIANGQVWRHV